MQAGAAREVAAAWLQDEWLPWAAAQGRAAGFRGAYVMGSLAVLDDAGDFDATASDLDIAIAVDAAVLPVDRERYPHGKFSVFRGCFVQAIFLPVDVLGDREALLSMLGLGCNLRNARILADPIGALAAARQVLAQEWAEQPWLGRRTERAITFAQRTVTRLSTAASPMEQLDALTDLVMELGGLIAIASAVTPTHRRSLAVADELLTACGRADLSGRLLHAIGAQAADAASVGAATADALAAVEIERRYAGASADVTPELADALPGFVESGIRQIVDEGRPGAAMLPALQSVALSASRVGPDAKTADRHRIHGLARDALARAGVPPQSWEQRSAAVVELTSDVIGFCRDAVARTAGVSP